MNHVETLKSRLVVLDCLLTGRSSKEVLGQLHHKSSLFENNAERFLMGEMYYLSDGGYSRVFWYEINGPLLLSSESLEAVRERWIAPEVIKTREAIADVCRELLKVHGWTE